jgi:membrane associated rhomboid family serine protease
MLARGDGLHPLQWLTSFFMHADIMHLVGNMIFLWAFGLVVEGKIGVFRYLTLYLAIGVLHGALMQILSLGAEEGHILGASAAIYGLLGICVIWAPANNLTCAYFFGIAIRVFHGTINIAILMFAIFYIGWEFVVVVFTHGAMSTPFLHLTGALIGLALGLLTFKLGFVDCENWDIFSVMSGHEGRPADKKRKPRPRPKAQAQVRAVEERWPSDEPAPAPAATSRPRRSMSDGGMNGDASDAATRRLRRHLEAGEALAAHAAYDRSMRTVAGWSPDGHDWQQLMKALLDAKESRLAIGVMEDYLRRAEHPSTRVRLKLAQLLVREFDRPAHALRVLHELDTDALPADLEAFRVQLVAEAERMSEEGVLELEGDSW